MKLFSRILTLVIAAVACVALPAIASAARIYYLVGVRHVYRIGPDKYFHSDERKAIEEDYADEVSADNAHYQYQISHGADPNTESAQLQSALHDLAVERDRRLTELYPQVDYVREHHPEFNIQVDGPYQVIGVTYHTAASVEVWDNYTVYAPWPGYTYVDGYPYGWRYGVVYTPSLFIGAYHGWYGGWVGFGSPAFIGFYGMGGPVVVAGLSVNVGLGFSVGVGFGGFFYNPGLGGYWHRGPGYFARDPFRGGYIASYRDTRAVIAGRAGYAAGAYAVRSARAAGYAAGIRAGARSSFAGARPTFSAGRAGAGMAHSGYVHSATGARTRGGSFAHSTTPTRSSGYSHSAMGAASRTRGGSFAPRTNTSVRSNSMRSGTAHTRSTSGRGSFGAGRRSTPVRSSGASRPATGGRSFGGGRPASSGRSFGGGRSAGSGRSFGGGRPASSGRSFGGGRSSGSSHSSGGGNRRRGG